jgi:hypothetical protein
VTFNISASALGLDVTICRPLDVAAPMTILPVQTKWRARYASIMDQITQLAARSGKIGYALLWILGVPLPILLLIYILKGCQ